MTALFSPETLTNDNPVTRRNIVEDRTNRRTMYLTECGSGHGIIEIPQMHARIVIPLREPRVGPLVFSGVLCMF